MTSPGTNLRLAGLVSGLLLLACSTGESWLADQGCVGTADPPAWLSETGCFEGASLMPASTLIAYEVQAPLWSDGAEKHRYVTMPDGAAFEVDAQGRLLLPPGGVLIKEFAVEGRRLETRFLSRDLEGQWHFATYAWDEGALDARLVEEGEELAFGEGTWTVPSLRDCETCHADASGPSIGLSMAQLDGVAPHPFTGEDAEQLNTLRELRWLAATSREPSTLVAPDSSEDLESRARSYLHGNCAFCHDGNIAALDLRYDVALEDTGACDTPPEYGDFFVEDARVLVPGEPEASLLLLRMQTEQESWRMPALGSVEVDEFAVELVREWILGLESCP